MQSCPSRKFRISSFVQKIKQGKLIGTKFVGLRFAKPTYFYIHSNPAGTKKPLIRQWVVALVQ